MERRQIFEMEESSNSGEEESKLIQGLVFFTIINDQLCPCSLGPDPDLFRVAWNGKYAYLAVVRFRNIKDKCDLSMYN